MKTFYENLKKKEDYYSNLFNTYFDDDKRNELMLNLTSATVYDGFVILHFYNHVNYFKEDIDASNTENACNNQIFPHFHYKTYKTVTEEEIIDTFKYFCDTDYETLNIEYLTKTGDIFMSASFNNVQLEIIDKEDIPSEEPLYRSYYGDLENSTNIEPGTVNVYIKVSYTDMVGEYSK